ncbi:Crp/Fnr family transcriptional regulator [Sinomicrobium soli]|uniref:Crp/Fnr family transcriptional regulator n=1 Tax=Sinomicrobium sp. N-1-3-6 TaxID=2219864 RepID=UPI000DCBA7ED|nr:Crp/Fnr family transcriptional regulator [Sinomicrobium sp. N-1-3-6]RAV30288.1 Crp/Fnr family transcriptional regulator [Sinomicrobium sp. N-1-3-6]
MIDPDLLLDFGAELVSYDKGDIIFHEKQRASNYFQIFTGQVKMNNFTGDGKEFIQGLFSEGESFGEPPLFVDISYPANAEALTDCSVYRLSRTGLYRLLESYPDEHLKVTRALAGRLYYKSIMASELSGQEAEHRILRILDYLKKHVYHLEGTFSFRVDLTRQQIADLTGLRVETVIRAGKSLEQKGELKLVNRKIYR